MYWVTLALLWSECDNAQITILEADSKNTVSINSTISLPHTTLKRIRELMDFFRWTIAELSTVQSTKYPDDMFPVYVWIQNPNAIPGCLGKWISSKAHPLFKPWISYKDALEIILQHSSFNHERSLLRLGTFYEGVTKENDLSKNNSVFQKLLIFSESLPVSGEKREKISDKVRKIWYKLGNLERGYWSFRAYSGSIFEDIRDACLRSIYADDFSVGFFSNKQAISNLGITSRWEKNPPFSNVTALIMAWLYDEKEGTKPWFVKIKNRTTEK